MTGCCSLTPCLIFRGGGAIVSATSGCLRATVSLAFGGLPRRTGGNGLSTPLANTTGADRVFSFSCCTGILYLNHVQGDKTL